MLNMYLSTVFNRVQTIQGNSIKSRIKDSYDEPHRYYHNAFHIERMLADWFSLRSFVDSENYCLNVVEPIVLAIIYHDVVYEIGSKENETLSAARLMLDLEGTNLAVEDLARAAKMIHLSALHLELNPRDVDNFEALFLNLDLRSLSYSYNTFLMFQEQIVKEYSALAPEDVIRKKQAKFLVKFLDKSRIYFHNPFIYVSPWEKQARTNIERFAKETL